MNANEIYVDNVSCTHGNKLKKTSNQPIGKNAIFYVYFRICFNFQLKFQT